jgi:hypothetical protein
LTGGEDPSINLRGRDSAENVFPPPRYLRVTMGLIDAFKKLDNWGMDVGISLIVKAPLENAWAAMLSDCIQQGYWIIESDQAARQFCYLVPTDWSSAKLFRGGQKIVVCVASLGQQACAVTLTADAFNGENNSSQSELTSKGRQRELIGWLVAKLESRFAIAGRSSTPNTPSNLPAGGQTQSRSQSPATRSRETPQSRAQGGPSFDFLG